MKKHIRYCLAPLSIILLIACQAPAPPQNAQKNTPLTTTDQIVRAVRTAWGTHQHADIVQWTGEGQNMGLARTCTLSVDTHHRFVLKTKYALPKDNPLSVNYGYDGEHYWEQGNGISRILELGERDAAIIHRGIVTGSLFDANSSTLLTHNPTDDTADCYLLRFQLSQGKTHGHILIDKTTRLPKQWTWSGEGPPCTCIISDYERFEGRQFPRHFRFIAANQPDSLFAFKTCRRQTVTPGNNPFVQPANIRASFRFRANLPTDLQVKRTPYGYLLVHPRINGQDLGWFLFDSGASGNLLSTDAAKQAHIHTFGKTSGDGIGGNSPFTLAHIKQFDLGPMHLTDQFFGVVDLEHELGSRWPELKGLGGVIGYDTFIHIIAEVDQRAGTISLYDPATYPQNDEPWRPLSLYKRSAHLPAILDKGNGLFTFDTGAPGRRILFNAPFTQRLDLLKHHSTEASQSGGFGGFTATQNGLLEWIDFGGHRAKRKSAFFATEAKGTCASPYVAGILSGDLLPCRVLFDYPHKRIAFMPQKTEAIANQTPTDDLVEASKFGDLDALENALTAGAKIEAPGKEGYPALHMAAGYSQLHAVKLLLAFGAKADTMNGSNGNTLQPIHAASGSGNIAIMNLLLAAGAKVDATTTREGWQPIHLAAQNGQLESIKHLLKAGAKIDIKDHYGWQPIHYAAKSGQLNALKYLKDNGANINQGDAFGMQPLHLAAEGGHDDMVTFLLTCTQVNTTSKDGWQAIHAAAKEGRVSTLKILLAAGADANARSTDGWTPLFMTLKENHLQAAKLLLNAGAKADATIKDGWQPLHYAAMNGNVEMAKALFAAGAKASAKNIYGETPQALAARMHHAGMAAFLAAQELEETK